MYNIFWTSTAEKDLTEIILYYFEKGDSVFASLVFNKIKNEIETLAEFPNRTRIGRVKKTREFLIKRLPYIAIISIDENSKNVNVLNIIHTARKYP